MRGGDGNKLIAARLSFPVSSPRVEFGTAVKPTIDAGEAED